MRQARNLWTLLIPGLMALAVTVIVTGCTSAEKAPAEAAIKATETTLNTVRAEASKYVPDQVKSLEDVLKSAKAAFDKGDYKVALASAKDLPAKATELGAAAAAKKAELTKTWEDLSGGLPKMAEAIKSRVDILSQSKKLPAGLDQAKFDSAKAGLAEVNKQWSDASEAYKSGNVADAISKAKVAKDKAVEAMTALNMQVPEAAK